MANFDLDSIDSRTSLLRHLFVPTWLWQSVSAAGSPTTCHSLGNRAGSNRYPPRIHTVSRHTAAPSSPHSSNLWLSADSSLAMSQDCATSKSDCAKMAPIDREVFNHIRRGLHLCARDRAWSAESVRVEPAPRLASPAAGYRIRL